MSEHATRREWSRGAEVKREIEVGIDPEDFWKRARPWRFAVYVTDGGAPRQVASCLSLAAAEAAERLLR